MRGDGSTRREWQSFWEQKRRQVFTPASASGGPQLTPFKQEVMQQRIEGTTSPSLWPPPHLHLPREGMRPHLLGTVKPSTNLFKIQRIGSQKWISTMVSNPWACDSEQQGLAAGQRDSDNGWIRSTISVRVGWGAGGRNCWQSGRGSAEHSGWRAAARTTRARSADRWEWKWVGRVLILIFSPQLIQGITHANSHARSDLHPPGVHIYYGHCHLGSDTQLIGLVSGWESSVIW